MLEQQIAAAMPFSVLLFDIDDFKQINDLHGHQTGDHALRLVSEALRQGTRSGDSVFRIGGEEFCALLPGLTERDAFAVAEGVRQKVATILSSLPNPVTVSVGVASFPAHGDATRRAALGRRRRPLRLQARRQEPHQRRGRRGAEGSRALAPRGRPRPAAPEGPRHGQPQRPRRDPHRRDRPRARLEDARLDDLRTAARLHDIGKLAVPDAILNKAGSLDEDEFRIIKTHPVVGAELLRSWGLPGPATIVLQHHERIDGSGYPSGLRGDEIRLESRIVHAADAYVAMMRDRPYRKAMGQEEAFAELARHGGTQFDSDVVAALVEIELARGGAPSETIQLEPPGTEDERPLAA